MKRISFPTVTAALVLAFSAAGAGTEMKTPQPSPDGRTLTLFLGGDVMTGRGIDQVLPHPSDPALHESYMKDARGYVEIAERANGPIPRPADFAYVWGDVLAELSRARPAARVVNLETAVTASDAWWRGKGINYRMHPANVPVLTAAGIDVAVLANNHVLDWGHAGLEETLATLAAAGIRIAGAGSDLQAAQAPALVSAREGRVVVFAFGAGSSGIPESWGATAQRPGVNLLPDLSGRAVGEIAGQVRRVKRPGDVVVASLHWGGNWGYAIPEEQVAFARRLIDEAGVDLVHGHSSHHVKAIEVYRGKLILYGCGDLINDYEGIGGYEGFRDDLSLLYFPRLDPDTGRLASLRMVPMQLRNFRLHRASPADVRWLREVLVREGGRFGTAAELAADGSLLLRWGKP